MCEKLAQSLHHLTTSEERELFDFGKRGGETAPIVMMLDRKEDPVTPLLLQWTYQAMVQELIGIHTNRVDLTQVPGVSLPHAFQPALGQSLQVGCAPDPEDDDLSIPAMYGAVHW